MDTTAERFWAKVDGGDVESCWLWAGSLDLLGYGQFRLNGKTSRAHRYAYESMVAPIPKGLVIDHLCRTRACINPWHLEPVPQRVNVARGEAGAYLAARTHCPQGHPYDDENTYRNPQGERSCRTCHRERARVRMREYRARQRAA